MRTTISIDDAIWENVHLYATSRGMKMGSAVEDLLRRGLEPRPLPARPKGKGWIPFEAPPEAPVLTTERLLELEDEE